MIKKYLAICVCLIVVANALGQSRSRPMKRSRPVKQPREVIEAYQVCTDFRHLLAKDLDVDLAFEATFTKDPARRRAIAMADNELGDEYLGQVDDAMLIGLYKDAMQLLVLVLPLMFATSDNQKAELFPPPIEAMLDRKPPQDPQKVPEFAAQLKRDVADFRAHVDKVAARNPAVAKNIQEYKNYLLKPLDPPKHVVKPLTGYSKSSVLPLNASYYQIDDCAVIRENGQMRLIDYTFVKLRF